MTAAEDLGCAVAPQQANGLAAICDLRVAHLAVMRLDIDHPCRGTWIQVDSAVARQKNCEVVS